MIHFIVGLFAANCLNELISSSSIKCQKKVKNVTVLFKGQDNILNCNCFFPKPNNIQFPVEEEQSNQRTLTYTKQETENQAIFFF